ALVDRYTALPIKADAELAVDGQFLIANGIKPGPKLGQILLLIKQKVIAGEVENTQEAIEDFLNQIE
ncbi:MAG: CCA tRNA nucleotidyltransferase, partial [Lactobacillus helsingborgensis]|nr:CCA tRNA nucleotidyltransferase [Lactobacillus helsingborgensis]MCT6866058.1 CCA tRNA nucleotidyltransferase [Lactobacillus panisapium]